MARRKKGSVKETDTVVITNVDLATADVTGVLPVANGGTGSGSYTDGQLLIGNTSGNTLTKATLTAGANITITNGGGSITIAASSGGSLNFAYATKTDTATNSTTGEQETGLQVAITPSSETAKILVWGHATISGDGYGVLQLKDGSTYLLRGDAAGSRTRGLVSPFGAGTTSGAYPVPIPFTAVYVPGVTTERTIKLIWHKLTGNNFYLNRQTSNSDSSTVTRHASIICALEIP